MNARIPLAVFVGLLLASFFHDTRAAPGDEAPQALIKRGEQLVSFGGCDDCHTPKLFTDQGPVPDPSRRLSGHPSGTKLPAVPQGLIGPESWGALTNNDFTAWVGPWGTSFTANLTPDKKTGLGTWTADVFINAMRTGKHAGVGRDILPPMPWPALASLSDEDLGAIFAFLGSLKPIENAVPQPVPPEQ